MLVVKKSKLKETVNTKSFGSQIDNHINWKNHTEQVITKSSAACYTISVTLTLSYNFTVNIFTFIKYGLIFCSNSSNSRKIFTLHKKIFRIMAGAQLRTSRSSLLKQLETLPVPCQYILSLMSCIIFNREIC